MRNYFFVMSLLSISKVAIKYEELYKTIYSCESISNQVECSLLTRNESEALQNNNSICEKHLFLRRFSQGTICYTFDDFYKILMEPMTTSLQSIIFIYVCNTDMYYAISTLNYHQNIYEKSPFLFSDHFSFPSLGVPLFFSILTLSPKSFLHLISKFHLPCFPRFLVRLIPLQDL